MGQYFLGFSASELRSPDACRGSVYFYDSVHNDMAGNPVTLQNTICIYEEDAGILWRKKDPETNRILTARSQRLVVTFIATLGNYDYQIKFVFYQDGNMKVEVTLTGILSQNMLGTKSKGSPPEHGTQILSQTYAQYHQHFFAARLDVELDGERNSVSVVDVVPDSDPPGSITNPYGNGFHDKECQLSTAASSRTNISPGTSRTWRISGESLNPITGTPRSWRLIPENGPHCIIPQSSVLHEKAAFTDFDVWVTPYKEGQLYAAGLFLDNGGDGLAGWIKEDPEANIQDTDIVLWHIFGMTHIPRLEDTPVMPSEYSLKS
jgi:primary-amine oxidase